ncbi:2,3,4,5-tetrahydropyridine-2,6-dicarboxylate N-succinyltransferase [Marinomonas mediterranea]|jgi:2,3,4,5-tetrahydropyridine-2,6-dicarboxylate N-succinyltransferase|uniref:2,3,4,5-tetrahydropyridine-2,6-dicarboxylate N-succinyltransferase n=1 Tax=Marinomonas mediterranea (strain ATCC 700492 / JCM 21426 / NBRC 103028 / MMB-1) TaxID=717774 RepID=F2JTZ4_MARM1|nr:2,3,4,5-tetrahydropyridine-2,6-dicarboxylate N-succinyltransferase [Marinomonas mediterranea]ADZ90415.1 2,3,4,5-tetrahydropyridine-2,6-dicarboxylate N-succinyltransferase [Marinomonas mediterranea MMB-1]WCN08469.1 2,3,4,5-tetrahydropyridine-2,6-dicarboxylate N-succinyltransferase [Marinomonas mediterranea]WCN12524.1 2,3,4,5-tetrahydropyridine-2,6-dicarboxylate N-succinyltransferase [Marinomonas mediterranea]WCN16595.1 2,3,4,5-tetrahydropyridine-2,6-dicarboxylate N-succinyltransferase [Marino
MSNSIFAFGLGVGTQNNENAWLEVFYAAPAVNPENTVVDAILESTNYEGGNATLILEEADLNRLHLALLKAGNIEQAELASKLKASKQPVVLCVLAEDAAPTNPAEVHLKLQLISNRLVQPHNTVLDGMFGLLVNTAWTSDGPIDVKELADRQLAARMEGRTIEVFSVDKFPKMANFVVPSGVRIGDASRIRLGAHLGEGTTVMHEGFVNFNAGTLGVSMVEGRISAGVVVGNGSDLGGGCSTMGTLSGGGNIVIGVGKECLIGANAGIGIGLGDRCTIESGLYITAGSKVAVLDENNKVVSTVKARELSGQSDLLFRRNSETGAIECKTNKTAIALNEALHAHN